MALEIIFEKKIPELSPTEQRWKNKHIVMVHLVRLYFRSSRGHFDSRAHGHIL